MPQVTFHPEKNGSETDQRRRLRLRTQNPPLDVPTSSVTLMNLRPLALSTPDPSKVRARRRRSCFGTPDANPDEGSGVVLFDGPCALCNRAVQLLRELDSKGALRFLPIQSKEAEALLTRRGARAHALNPEEVILVDEEGLYFGARAWIRAGEHLGGAWAAFASLAGRLPGKLVERLYGLVARRRYALFGSGEPDETGRMGPDAQPPRDARSP